MVNQAFMPAFQVFKMSGFRRRKAALIQIIYGTQKDYFFDRALLIF